MVVCQVPLSCPLSFHNTNMYDEKTPIINRQDTIQLMQELRKAIDSRINREIPGIVGLKKSAATVASHVVGIPVGGLGAISESTLVAQYTPKDDTTVLKSFTLMNSSIHLALVLLSLLVSSILSCAVSSFVINLFFSAVRSYFEHLRRIKFMQRLKTVVQSNPYKEPKYKDMYLKKLEQLAGK
jgi:hypothetical protein